MILHLLSKIFASPKRTFWLLLCLVGVFLLQTQGAFAVDQAAATGISPEDSQKLIGYLNGFLQMAAAVLGLVTGFISIFLYPGWVNGTMFGLQDYLKIIWVLVSNVVYFIFAGILIVIAFMNIIGKGDGMWELKQAMPKFIVGVLIVPFSWFFVQFLLSLSAILTVGVLTLPYDSFQNEELFGAALEESQVTNEKFCKDIIISLSGDFGGQAVTSLTESDGASFPEQIKCKDEEGSKVSIKDIVSGENGGVGLDNSVFGIISVYTYGILRVQEADTIKNGDLTSVKGIMDLIFKIIFDLLFVVVYLILMVALFLALMVRGVRLWVYMMLSPIFGLLYFLGKGKEGFGGETKFSITEFVSLAMVPVYVAAALAFGLVFILVATEGIKQKSSSDDLDTLKAGGFSISIIGAHSDGGQEEKSVIAKLIVELFGVVILWIAVMAALGASEVTKTVTQPVRDFGSSVGKLVTASPTYLPILPASLGGSAAGLQTMGSTIQTSVSGKMAQAGTDRGRAFMGDTDGGGVAGKIQDLTRQIDTSQAKNNSRYFAEQAKSLLAAMPKDSWTNPTERKAFIDALEKLGFSADDIAKLDLTSAQRASDTLAQELARRSPGGLAETQSYKEQILNTAPASTPAAATEVPGTPPVVTPTAANNFNVTATIVGDGTITPERTAALRTAIDSTNINDGNRAQIKASILAMIPPTDTDRESKAEELVKALGLV